jgi:hypothetical protein
MNQPALTQWHTDFAATFAAAVPMERPALREFTVHLGPRGNPRQTLKMMAESTFDCCQNVEDMRLDGERVDVQPAAPDRAAQLKAYVAMLQAHDFDFEFSDDHRVYTAGREALAELRMLRRDLDADGAIWNSIAPAAHRVA